MTPQDKVVKIAMSWIGTPYHHMGRVKKVGVDCAMLIAEVYHEAGVMPKIDVGYYPPDWHHNHRQEVYIENVLQYAQEVETPQRGDMVLWKFARTFSHGAIVIDWPIIIHASLDQPVCLENAEQANWLKFCGRSNNRPREVKFYRLKEWCK